MLPVGVQRFVAGSYSSALGVYAPPPATSTRPSRSGVAVMWARAVAMLAVAVQLPEPEPEATVGTARTKRAQPARASDLMLTTNPRFLAGMNEATIGRNTSRRAYEFLKPARRADVHFCPGLRKTRVCTRPAPAARGRGGPAHDCRPSFRPTRSGCGPRRRADERARPWRVTVGRGPRGPPQPAGARHRP